MNDKELMDKIYDRDCADSLPASELLSRRHTGGRVRSGYAAPIAAAVVIAAAAGIFIALRSQSTEAAPAEDPVSKASQAEDSSRSQPADLSSVQEDSSKPSSEVRKDDIAPPGAVLAYTFNTNIENPNNTVTVWINGAVSTWFGVILTDEELEKVAEWVKYYDDNASLLSEAELNDDESAGWLQRSDYSVGHRAELMYTAEDGRYFYLRIRTDVPDEVSGMEVMVQQPDGSSTKLLHLSQSDDAASAVEQIMLDKIQLIIDGKYHGKVNDTALSVIDPAQSTRELANDSTSLKFSIINNTGVTLRVWSEQFRFERFENGEWKPVYPQADVAYAGAAVTVESDNMPHEVYVELSDLMCGGLIPAGKYRCYEDLCSEEYDDLYNLVYEFSIKEDITAEAPKSYPADSTEILFAVTNYTGKTIEVESAYFSFEHLEGGKWVSVLPPEGVDLCYDWASQPIEPHRTRVIAAEAPVLKLAGAGAGRYRCYKRVEDSDGGVYMLVYEFDLE